MTPFEGVDGHKTPLFLPYMLDVSEVQYLDRNITTYITILRTLKENLVMDQNHMKQQADQGHSEHPFIEGDQVFLHLQPYMKIHSNLNSVGKIPPNFMVLILFSSMWDKSPISYLCLAIRSYILFFMFHA
jgi:hypothetical protein